MPEHQPTSHWFDAIPFGVDGCELTCFLDGPATHWRLGCGCGWRGSQTITVTTAPSFLLTDADWDRASAQWRQQHYFPAILGDVLGEDGHATAVVDCLVA